jgi:hypothetical protein
MPPGEAQHFCDTFSVTPPSLGRLLPLAIGTTTVAMITLAILVILAVVFFALHKINPKSFKIHASMLRLFFFDLEIELRKRLPPKRSTED